MITTFPAFMAWRNLQRLSRTPALPFRAARLSTQRNFHVRPTSPALRKLAPPSIVNRVQLRRGSDHVPPNPLTNRDEEVKDKSAEEIAARKAQEPAYEMTFTCRKCITRSSHRVTKQAYHFGTTLITCPGCKNRHLISDHLKVRREPETKKEMGR